MMKQSLLIAILLGLALQTASAAEKTQTRGQCMARCLPAITDAKPDEYESHQNKLKAIRAKREGVSDPDQLNKLQQQETDEVERFLNKHEKLCASMCSYFPET